MTAQRCGIVGCRNQVQHWREGLCEAHFRQRQRDLHDARERRGIRETGEQRQGDWRDEVELTDGQMTWWVTAALWERRGWFVRVG